MVILMYLFEVLNPKFNFSTSKREAFHENFKTKWLLSEMGYTIQNLFLSV